MPKKSHILLVIAYGLISSHLAINTASAQTFPFPDDPDPGFLHVIAGGDADLGNDGPAALAHMTTLTYALDIDDKGRLYFFEGLISQLRRINTDGNTEFFATIPASLDDFVVSGDYLYYLAPQGDRIYRIHLETKTEQLYASLDLPDGALPEECCSTVGDLAVNSAGDVYLYTNNRIFKFDQSTNNTSHFAGNGETERGGAGISALEVSFTAADIVIDPSDQSLLILDQVNMRVSRIDPVSGVLDYVSDELPQNDNELNSLGVLPNGDILVTHYQYIHRVSTGTGEVVTIAGNGSYQNDGDGGPALDAGIRADQLATDSSGNYYFGLLDVPSNIRFVDTQKDIVSTILGTPGRLGCASPLDSILQNSYGIEIGPDGRIYLQSEGAILAIDRDRDVVYTVAGVYGRKGNTEDGELAFNSPMNIPDSPKNFAIAANGDVFIAEESRLRRIDHTTGRLQTLVEGKFWAVRYQGDSLYAIRNPFWEPIDFVKIDPSTGQVTTLVAGGPDLPVVGESAHRRLFGANIGGRLVNGFQVDSAENIYLAISKTLAPDLPTGVYRIDGQTKVLSVLTDEAPDSPRNVSWQMALDEERGFLYYSRLMTGNFTGGETWMLPIVKIDLASGEQTWFAGSGQGQGRNPTDPLFSFGENPLQADFVPDAITIDSNGDLLVAASQGAGLQAILRISPDPPLADGLIPGDLAEGANAGLAVARYQNWLAIGVPNSNLPASGSGEVLLYQDNDCRPILRERLQAPEGAIAEQFGKQLTFAGGALIVGAGGSSSQVSRIQSGIEDNATFQMGVFGVKGNSRWQLKQNLSSLLPPAQSGVETSLVSDQNMFAVGTPEANDGAGEVTVFATDDLSNPVTVVASDVSTSGFGQSLALEEGRLAVGLESESTAGAVEIFDRNGSDYELIGSIESTDNDTEFASALAMNDQALYVGSPRSTGGRVFGYNLSDLELIDTVSDPFNSGNPSFGAALAIEDGVLVVGAPDTPPESSSKNSMSSMQTNGGPEIDAVPGIGTVFAFGVKTGSGRSQLATTLAALKASTTEAYGHAVDISDGRIVVGAPETNDGRGAFDAVGDIVSATDLSGLWYDPALDGEGYNILVAGAGVVVFFYGYDSEGERLWLISDTVTDDIRFGEDMNVSLYKAIEGEFAAPVSSGQALVKYGLLTMTFGSLRSATFSINGFDGNKISRLAFLADTTANDSAYSGLWYDVTRDGEGYNVISGKPGTVIYYYGSTSDGERLWLISDVLTNAIGDGTTIQGKMYEANGGDFFHPAPSSTALEDWGTIEARFDDCTGGRFALSGNDGNKTSDVIKLAGVDGSGCR